MNSDTRASAGVPAAQESGATDARTQQPRAGVPDTAGRLLGRLSVLPALVVMAWLLAGLPLLLIGAFTPLLMLAIWVPLAAVLILLGVRWTPGRWQNGLADSAEQRTPWWAMAGVLVVAAAFGIDQMIYHSQQIIVLRDPASYFQFGYWIAHHGSLPIPQSRAAFGGLHHGLTFHSAAFYQVGTSIVPQFMAGLPMLLAAGFWTGGAGAALGLAPVLGACAVLTFGGLAARLIGPRWAPLAALVLALSLPEQFTSRSSYSEPVVQILFLGGFCLVIDSLAARDPGRAGELAAQVTAALGGLAFGLTVLVRIDGASDILPVIPYCGLLLISRRKQGLPLLGGLLAGALFGIVDGLALSRPYLVGLKGSLVPLALLGVVAVVATSVAVVVFAQRGLPQVRGHWLQNAVTVLIVLVMIGFAIRPYFQTVRAAHTLTAVIAMDQRAQHLPVDPHRMYAEISLRWVFWYLGVPAVVLATFGAVLLARRCLRGTVPAWTLPLLTFGWTIVIGLYRPEILPDQPWASRRFVPAVLPGLILFAVWASGWLLGWARRQGYDQVIRAGLVTGCAAVLLVPTAMTTFGIQARHGGPLGIRPVATGLGFRTTFAGELAAVNRLCAALPRDASVVMIGEPASRFTEVVRGMCGEPVAVLRGGPGALAQIVRGMVGAGRRPVLLADRPSLLAGYCTASQVLRLRLDKDPRTLTIPPTAPTPATLTLWMAEPTA